MSHSEVLGVKTSTYIFGGWGAQFKPNQKGKADDCTREDALFVD